MSIIRKKYDSIPANLFVKCERCDEIQHRDAVKKNLQSCTKCGHYFKMNPREYINLVTDKNTFVEDTSLDVVGYYPNPIKFDKYVEKTAALRDTTNEYDSVVIGIAKINGVDTAIGAMNPNFIMGSLGSICGEKITHLFEVATKEKMPVILFTVSGGARMQEGIISLMQMAKTSAAVKRHSDAGLFYMPILTHPTTGGVSASFAMLGDIILAEKGATVAFAGARVIEQTIRQELPQGFQSAEYVEEHGFIDNIVERKELRKSIQYLVKVHAYEK